MENGKIKVVLDVQSSHTDTYFTNIQRALRAGSTTPDIFAGDVIWPAQLAGQNVLLPLDKYFPASVQKQYIPGTIQDVHYNGTLYGMPWFTDFGLIYYRKDLLQKYHLPVPQTWATLQTEARLLVSKKAVKEGFVFQGSQYEGLVCDALEYINGAGGAIYGSKSSSTTSQTAAGLQEMRSMITSGASPSAVTTYDEAATANDFTNGTAAFARNWPYMWALAQASKTVAGKVGVTNMMHSPGQSTAYSTLGGWWLGINKNSKNPDAAVAFMKYLTSMAGQQIYAIKGGHAVSLIAANDSSSVQKALPWLAPVTAHLAIAPRPTSPVYNDISLQMQKDFHGVLAGSMQPNAAVSDIEAFIKTAEARFH
jgi:multiple sugar transport system substrate-binding protein